jgi:hypothetical protein
MFEGIVDAESGGFEEDLAVERGGVVRSDEAEVVIALHADLPVGDDSEGYDHW